MEALYTNIDIDFSQYSFQTIQAVAGETGDSRGVIVSLYNEGQPYYIPDVNAVECYIMGTKSDNKYADTKCTIIDDNTVSFTLTDQMVAVPGTGEYSLVLMDFNDGTVLKSFGFKVHVEENAENINIVISSNEFNILMDALNEAKEATDAAKENLEQTQQALEEVLTSKEAIETLAENLSILNETIVQGEADRTNAEAERIAAETERINAESARQNAFDEAIAEANEIIDACKDIVTDSANLPITFEDYENIDPPAFNDSVSSIASGEKLPNLMQHIKGALLSVEDVLENVDISSQKTLLVDVPTLGWEGNNPYTITLSAPGVKIDSSIVYYLVTKEDDASPEEMLTMRNILSVDPGIDVITLTANALPKTEITLALGGLSNNVEFIPSNPSGGNSEDLAALEERVEAVEDQSATALSIAKGKNQAHIFNTTDDMNAWMSVSSNAGLYTVGDNIYIIDTDVPDWWVSEVLTEADPDTGFYYKIAQLETQKVDLTNYVSKEQLDDLREYVEEKNESQNDEIATLQARIAEQNDKFAIITGTTPSEASTVSIEYPTGFNKENCVILSFECSKWNVWYNSAICKMDFNVSVNLQTANIGLEVGNASDTSKNCFGVPYRIVLYKFS